MGHPDSIRHPRVSGNLVYVGQAVQHRGSIQFPVLVWANWIHVSESNHILICNFCREFAEIPVPLSIAVSFDVRLTININRPFQLQSEGLGGQNCALPFLIAFYSKTFFFLPRLLLNKYSSYCNYSSLQCFTISFGDTICRWKQSSPSLTVSTGESVNFLLTSQTGSSVMLIEVFRSHLITHTLYLHCFR